ncbi:TPA: EpsG family protein [Morganella morganii]|nr:EpsG family protein [Morganella morganii]
MQLFPLLTSYFLLLIAALYISNKKDQAICDKFIFIIISLFFGLSYTNGWDWYGYLDYYEIIQKNGYTSVSDYYKYGIEYLYLLYLYIIGLTTLSFSFFIFINSLIINILIYKFCKKCNINYSIFILLYLAVSYLRLEFSTMKQMLAIAIILYAYSLILKDKILHSVFLIIIAAFIHRSSVIVLLLMPIITNKFPKSFHYGIILFALPVYYFSNEINHVLLAVVNNINISLLSSYLNKISIYLSFDSSSKINFQAMVILLFYLFLVITMKRRNIFLNLVCCHVIIVFYFSFLTQLMIIRLAYYFQIGWICCLIIKYQEKRYKYLYPIILMSIVIIKGTLNFRYESERNIFFPYYNVITLFFYNDEDYGRDREYIARTLLEYQTETK